VALKRMLKVLCLCVSCLSMPWPAGVQAQSPPAKAGPAKVEKAAAAKDVSPLLAEIIQRHDIPGMTAVLIDGDTVVATGAAGLRKRGGKEKVTLDDRFHIGSCTKTMTATLCAMLVEQGKLKWDTTLAEAFPDAKRIHADYRKVTLEQLLTNRGGAPGNIPPPVWAALWLPKGTASRRMVLDTVFSQPPEVAPGTKYVYSNFGFAVAGHMAERAAKKPWEDLMRERLFKPLGMSSAGFGAPADRGMVRQPRGHRGATPVEPTEQGADNPPAIGPAGTVHCSAPDWAKFVALHLNGARGEGKLLKPETFKKLHTPPEGSPYAMGWLTGPSPLGKGVALNHAGSNTLWFAVTWVLPESNRAVVVMCNQGPPEGPASKACDEAVVALMRLPAGGGR
jgi:CubicO group peptidase (beta-lactamase class C family)